MLSVHERLTWLDELGYGRPAEDRVKIDLSYSTCNFHLRESPLEDRLSIISLGTPNYPTGAFFGCVGGDRYALSLTRMLGAVPPADLASFRDAAAELSTSRIHEAIKDAMPEEPPVVMRFPASVSSMARVIDSGFSFRTTTLQSGQIVSPQ